MNYIELNAILFYADFLSLKHTAQPVTDNCKYFFIYNSPINSAFIAQVEPQYDPNNKYFEKAKQEYLTLRNQFGDEGVSSFVEQICTLRACGTVDALQMLKCIHHYSSKKERKTALNTYYKWKEDREYSHLTINENGDPEYTKCSKYVAHYERALEQRKLPKSNGIDTEATEEQID